MKRRPYQLEAKYKKPTAGQPADWFRWSRVRWSQATSAAFDAKSCAEFPGWSHLIFRVRNIETGEVAWSSEDDNATT